LCIATFYLSRLTAAYSQRIKNQYAPSQLFQRAASCNYPEFSRPLF
jgi:hypothetical protein